MSTNYEGEACPVFAHPKLTLPTIDQGAAEFERDFVELKW